jgi:TrmH family RNA methyltransferase
MGCVSVLPWSRFPEDPFAVDPGHNDRLGSGNSASFPPGTSFFALETGGIELEDFAFPKDGVMIAGSEELGVSPMALAAADASLGRVSIPVFGAKGSLNVSVAFGIVMNAWAAVLQNCKSMV